MVFRNLHNLTELKELASVIDSYQFTTCNKFSLDLPVEQVPRSPNINYSQTKQETDNQKRINNTIKEFIKKQREAI